MSCVSLLCLFEFVLFSFSKKYHAAKYTLVLLTNMKTETAIKVRLLQRSKSNIEMHAINLRKGTIYLLTSCNTEERIARDIYIHNSNKNYRKFIGF